MRWIICFFSIKIYFYIPVTMESRASVTRQILTIIKRFKFEELPSAVIPIFPEISWSYIRSKLIKNHKNFTVSNAVRIIEEVVDNLNLSEKELFDRLATLEVSDVSKHSKRKIWYGYQLINPEKTVNYLGRQEIEDNITNQFELDNLKVKVKVLTYNSITYVYIREKQKRGKKRRYASTAFFALFLEHEYFFCSKKFVPTSFLNVITNSLGYNKYKRIKLMGKDLRSLMKLLWIKQQGVLDDIAQPPVYEPASPVVQHNGIDYTQNKQRKDYGNQCFGEEPPTLELLVVKGPETSIQFNDLPSISSLNLHMNWEFRGPNIINFLKGLIEKRVFTLPLPDYVSDFMKLGRNELQLV